MNALRLAYDEGLLTKEAVAFFWAVDFAARRGLMPTIKGIIEGVAASYGEVITRPTAGRALYKARRQCRKFSLFGNNPTP